MEHFGQIGILAWLIDRHHITDLNARELWPRQPEEEPFKLVRMHRKACWSEAKPVNGQPKPVLG